MDTFQQKGQVMKKALIVSIGILLCFVSSGIAATHYIKPDGTGDFPTIQDGINAAVAGDIVLLAAGTARPLRPVPR